MKKTLRITLSALFAVILLISAVSCAKTFDTEALWANATYKEDTAIGEGAKTITVNVVAGEKEVILTVSTDKNNLGDALFEYGLVNDPTFFDTCNGIKADYAKDTVYWEFRIDGKMQNNGIGDAVITGGEHFELVYSAA